MVKPLCLHGYPVAPIDVEINPTFTHNKYPHLLSNRVVCPFRVGAVEKKFRAPTMIRNPESLTSSIIITLRAYQAMATKDICSTVLSQKIYKGWKRGLFFGAYKVEICSYVAVLCIVLMYKVHFYQSCTGPLCVRVSVCVVVLYGMLLHCI